MTTQNLVLALCSNNITRKYAFKIKLMYRICHWRTQEFCSGRGEGPTNSVEDNGQRDSYSKIFLIFGTLRLFTMTTNLFVIVSENIL